jgi:hypothetical protein
MRGFRSRAWGALLLPLCLGLSASRPPAHPSPATPVLVVIVNKRNPAADLSLNELRAYFRLERSWPGNLPAKLWLRSSKQEDQILLRRVYKWDKQKRRKYFRARENRGEIKAPPFTPTAIGAGKKVAREEGAFSVVMSDEIPKDVKVLMIGGRTYDHPEYPLLPLPAE